MKVIIRLQVLQFQFMVNNGKFRNFFLDTFQTYGLLFMNYFSASKRLPRTQTSSVSQSCKEVKLGLPTNQVKTATNLLPILLVRAFLSEEFSLVCQGFLNPSATGRDVVLQI